MDITYEQFSGFLRSCLNYLYEPNQLRRNPLASLLGIAGRVDTPTALQRILFDAIEDLKPDEEDSAQPKAWLAYDVLFFRYVRGYSREAVASQLGISDRQLSRELRAAIDALALYLWKTRKLDDRIASSLILRQESSLLVAPLRESDSTSAATDEMDGEGYSWVEDLPTDRPEFWKFTLESVLELFSLLMKQNNVHLCYEPSADLPDLLIPQNALRQSLLLNLGWMIPTAQSGELTLLANVLGKDLILEVLISLPENTAGFNGASVAPLPEMEISRQLLEREGGSIHLVIEPVSARLTLSIPALAQIPVLVIDDNLDTIQLFHRYVQGTRFLIVGTTDPGEIYRLVEKHQPRIILLDVMMPETDGWDLLTRLRQNLHSQEVAILICSILPMESVARSLGADGFLQKPVLPQDFLHMLDEQIEHLPDEDR